MNSHKSSAIWIALLLAPALPAAAQDLVARAAGEAAITAAAAEVVTDARAETPAAATAQEQEVTPVTMTFGGRLQFDFGSFTESEPFGGLIGEVDSSYEVRRARMFAQGRLYDSVDYKFEVDFAGNEITAKDVYLGVRGLPITARVGIQKEPFSVEELTSSRYITFMERSLVNVFAPSRNFGLALGDTIDGRTTWSAGIFRDTDGFEALPGDNYQFTGRLTHALANENAGRQLFHLGVAFQHRKIEGSYKLSARPGDHTAPKLLSVSIPADSADVLNIEFAANTGSLGIQGEYVSSSVGALDGTDPTLNGYYVHASYFLTGENRPYSGGRFDRVRPATNFLNGQGSGAWEIALRYARLDLSEAAPVGRGELWNLTGGVNWYWNPRFRLMLNYELAGLPEFETDNTASVVHARLSMDF